MDVACVDGDDDDGDGDVGGSGGGRMSCAMEGDGCKKRKEEAAAVAVAVEKRTSRRGIDGSFVILAADDISSFVKMEFEPFSTT